MNSNIPGVSIVICCYNSASRITAVLQHLSLQKVDKTTPWEVVLIDNASTDNTQEVALNYWSSLSQTPCLRVALQLKPGLSYAREKGIEEAQYEYIIFCDDDNWLCETYVQSAYDIMTGNANIGIAGGWCEAETEISVEHWVIPFLPALAVGRPAEKTAYLAAQGKFVNGAGMVLRKGYFKSIKDMGFYSLLDDRTQNILSSGGDTELCWAIMFAGHEIYFDDSLYFKHFIPRRRVTKEYLLSLTTSSLYPVIVLDIYSFVYWNQRAGIIHFLLKQLGLRIYSLFYYGVRAFFGTYPLYSSVVLRQNLKLLWLLFTQFNDVHKDFDQIKKFRISLSNR